eukprot:7791548-Pyramimonas_sp.AAC.1
MVRAWGRLTATGDSEHLGIMTFRQFDHSSFGVRLAADGQPAALNQATGRLSSRSLACGDSEGGSFVTGHAADTAPRNVRPHAPRDEAAGPSHVGQGRLV